MGNPFYAVYFIFYVVFVTLIISNIFIGLFLSEIEALEGELSEDALLTKWRENHHGFVGDARAKKDQLLRKLNALKDDIKVTKKQVLTIDKLLDSQQTRKQDTMRSFT